MIFLCYLSRDLEALVLLYSDLDDGSYVKRHASTYTYPFEHPLIIRSSVMIDPI